jgi:hypothetical protein
MNSKCLYLSVVILLFNPFSKVIYTQDKPNNINKLLHKGDSLFIAKKHDSAKNIFNRVLEYDKNNSHAISTQGKISVIQKNWGEAKNHFGKILDQKPDDLLAHYFQGICYRETGKFKALLLRKRDWNKSKKHFLKVIDQDSLFKDVFFQFAKLKRYREKYKEAILLCHQQILLRPELIEPRVKLFRFYRYFIVNTNERKAISWLKTLSSDESNYAIAEKYRRVGKLINADSILQSLLKKNTKIPRQPIYLSFARIHSLKKQPYKTEKYFWLAVNSIKNEVEVDLVFENIKYIITDRELNEYSSLTSIENKIDFYRTLWTRRNPLPASDYNVRLVEHFKRLLYAEKYYEFDGFRTWFNNPDKQGYLDFTQAYDLNQEFNDKGLIYIRHGKANDWAVTVEDGIPSNESWLYYETQRTPKMTFHFLLENSAGYWRFTPTITNPRMVGDRINWGNIYHRLLRGDPMERLALVQEMAQESKESVSAGLSTDRHTWERKIKPLAIPSSIATFRGPEGKTILEVYYAISLAELHHVPNTNLQQYNVEKGISLHDQSWHLLDKKKNNQTIIADKDNFFIDFYRFEVQPDSYNVALFARPEKSDYLGGWKIKTFAENYSVPDLSISDIEMASLITSSQPGNKFNKNDLLVIPNPSKTYYKKKPVYIYFEVYNLQRNLTGSSKFTIEYTLTFLKGKKKNIKNLFGIFGGGGKSSIATTIEREGKEELSVEFLAIDVSKVKSGKHELEIKITDKISGEIVKKKEQLVLN